jgi:hypothetical protein
MDEMSNTKFLPEKTCQGKKPLERAMRYGRIILKWILEK